MNRIVQPSVAKRITFATWARKEGINRHSSATWTVPEGTEIPESLLAGAQIDGKPYEAPKPEPKRTRTRRTKPVEPVSDEPTVTENAEGFVFNKVDYPDQAEIQED
jgi:hypothetical protein